jgi:hypothetical protein
VTEADALCGRLLAETREELVRADGKASILLAGVGVVVGAVVSGLVSSGQSPTDLDRHAQWLFWVGTLVVCGGLVSLGAAVWPRIGAPRPGVVQYFGDVPQYGHLDELKAAIAHEAQDTLNRDAAQLRDLAPIVMRKYRLTRFGIGLSAAGLAFCGLAWGFSTMA